jgi:ubiquinone/menaquinone biosynthesis C-methylase UbiE
VNRSRYWKLKKKSTQHYDELADVYDCQYTDEQTQKYAIALDAVDEWSGDYILDLGCGTGLFIEAAVGLDGYIVAIDSSKKMIQKAKCNHADQNIFFLCADADYLPLREQTFNNICVFTLLQNVPDPMETITEIRRVAKKEAKLILTLLKKAQPRLTVLNLLNETGLRMVHFIDKEELKDYVAICVVL